MGIQKYDKDGNPAGIILLDYISDYSANPSSLRKELSEIVKVYVEEHSVPSTVPKLNLDSEFLRDYLHSASVTELREILSLPEDKRCFSSDKYGLDLLWDAYVKMVSQELLFHRPLSEDISLKD